MARPLRIDFPGAFHHVTSRGNRRGVVFRGDDDRRMFLGTLAEACRIYGWNCHAYCLMTNHYHLLIETVRATLSSGMRQLNGKFTQAFNRRHGAVGHVYQGRFKSTLVEEDAHLLEACRYVVLNPVRAGMAADPADWPWSSYNATAGRAETPDFLDVKTTRSLFSADERLATAQYRRFVMEGIGLESPFASAKGGILGSAKFVGRLVAEGNIQPGASVEVPAAERFPARPELSRLFIGVGCRGERDEAVRLARREYGFGVKELGDHLGLHYSTVSKIIGAGNSHPKT